MDEKLLNMSNVEFTCKFLAGKIIIFHLDFMVRNGSPILTKNTGLLYVGVCNFSPNAPVPCNKGLCKDWVSGLELNKKINGNPVLNKDASQICPKVGKIKAKLISTSKCAVLDTGAKILSEQINDALLETENNLTSNGVNKNVDFGAEKTINAQHQNYKEESFATEKGEPVEAIADKQEQESTKDYAYAVCGYKTCSRRDECEYLKAQYELSPETLDNASIQLRKNSPEKENIYNNKCNPLMEETQSKWGNQAHHIISIRQIFAKFPELVKLAYFYGYDINSKENCIFLPSVFKNYEINEQQYKTAQAYEVMSVSGMQWHSGGHSYKISKDDFNNISDEKRNLLRCYEEVVTEEVKKLIIPYYFRDKSCCRYDKKDSSSKKAKAERFISRMNYVADKVYKKLDSFSEPKTSFPFFVSKLSMQYAYNAPRSGKFIYIEEIGSNIVFTKYKYTKNKKDDNNIILSEKGEFKELNDLNSLIIFCENVKYFFVRSDLYNLPFKELSEVYQVEIDNTNLYIKKEAQVRYKKEITSTDREEILNKMKFFISGSLMNDTDSYKAPQSVILRRKKECDL